MKKLLAWWSKQPVAVTLFVYGVLILLVLLLGINTCRAANVTVQLSASPTTGISPLPVTLNWSSTGAVSCNASGGWSGAKALSGSETVTLTSTATFTLTCSAADGSAQLTWTAPTQNTDGSNIPATGPGSLAGFKLFHAPLQTNVATATPIVINDKAATTYTITGLPAGQRYYGAKAFNVELVDSDMSGLVNNVVTIPSSAVNAAVTVTTKPKPPVLVSVQQVVYEVKENPMWGNVLGRNVGTVPLGTQCGEAIVFTNGGVYYEIPKTSVTFTKPPKSEQVVVRCEEASG